MWDKSEKYLVLGMLFNIASYTVSMPFFALASGLVGLVYCGASVYYTYKESKETK